MGGGFCAYFCGWDSRSHKWLGRSYIPRYSFVSLDNEGYSKPAEARPITETRFIEVFLTFFFCFITFLTIGYGSDYININSFCAKLLSGFEGFAGLFLMSYFTVAFVRKVLR